MSRQDEWFGGERSSVIADAGMGALRITLLFGSAAIALALILVPVLDRGGHMMASKAGMAGVDFTQTGSIGTGRLYTIQRSVLQASPGAVCIIHQDGSRDGDC